MITPPKSKFAPLPVPNVMSIQMKLAPWYNILYIHDESLKTSAPFYDMANIDTIIKQCKTTNREVINILMTIYDREFNVFHSMDLKDVTDCIEDDGPEYLDEDAPVDFSKLIKEIKGLPTFPGFKSVIDGHDYDRHVIKKENN